jgi:hypothetical protein
MSVPDTDGTFKVEIKFVKYTKMTQVRVQSRDTDTQ